MGTPLTPERFQTSSRVLMVRPKAFGFHAQAATSNAFMHCPEQGVEQIAQLAQSEFDALVDALRNAGVQVIVHEDHQGLPDCLFPNNWMSWHTPVEGESVIVTYPMYDDLRRQERSTDVLDQLVSNLGSAGHLDLTALEDDDEYLEGTGSLVLDRERGVAYACISARTTPQALEAWSDETGYQLVSFRAVDGDGQLIYHTNVMMSVGSSIAVVCLESIDDAEEQEELLSQLALGDKEVITIDFDQMGSFCGNILELADTQGHPVLAMSSRAWEAFTAEQKLKLQSVGKIVHVPITTIEDVGGGGVRCMIAECGRNSMT
jgi:hypothetical protein